MAGFPGLIHIRGPIISLGDWGWRLFRSQGSSSEGSAISGAREHVVNESEFSPGLLSRFGVIFFMENVSKLSQANYGVK